MIVYSVELNLFIRRLEKFIFDYGIDIGYRFGRYDEKKDRPILQFKIATFEHKNIFGYYSNKFNRPVLGINKIFATMDFKLAEDIIKHEIAHFICDQRFGSSCQDHGPRFRHVCKEIGAEPLAKESLNGMKDRLQAEDHDKIVEKVKKLLALGSSDNPHEAELATLKANKILMKYNLSTVATSDVIYHKRLFRVGQKNAKNRAIMSILDSFGVFPVYSAHGKRGYIIEVSGTKANVEIADYVANFLNDELERLYKAARKKGGFGGLAAKNAFFNGIASGYMSKFRKQKSEVENENQQENQMTVFNQRMADMAEELIYEKLTYGGGIRERGHLGANASGYSAGKKLSINKGVQNKGKVKLLK